VITPEAQGYIEAGTSPEKAVVDAVPEGGGDMNVLRAAVGDPWNVGFKKAMEKKWIRLAKSDGISIVTRISETTEDACLALLKRVDAGEAILEKDAADLRKRKLCKVETWKSYHLSKGPAFALQRVKPATELTVEMLLNGDWKKQSFKEYNFKVLAPSWKPTGNCVCQRRNPLSSRLLPCALPSPSYV
jgi:phenylalanyl-tRNA synthetase alpha chain